MRSTWLLAVFSVTLAASPLSAQEAASSARTWPEAIEDNSFLIEEAYNQEPGVVQFIFNFLRLRPGGDWQMSFTNEWPVPGMRHQLSYTVPFTAGAEGRSSGGGDLQLNYRYQALEEDADGVAFAPRLSVILPTGSPGKGLGMGVTAYQLGLPFSKRLTGSMAAHLNLGASLWPGVTTTTVVGTTMRNLRTLSQGASAIWLVSPAFNLFLEGVASQTQVTDDGGRVRWSRQVLLNPGVRVAVNTRAGQLVAGVSAPIGVTRDGPDPSLFLYLSWEMPVWHPGGAPR